MNKFNILTVYELHIYELYKEVVSQLRHESSLTILPGTDVSEVRYMTRRRMKGLLPSPTFSNKISQNSLKTRVTKFFNFLKMNDLLEDDMQKWSQSRVEHQCHFFRDNFVINNRELQELFHLVFFQLFI